VRIAVVGSGIAGLASAWLLSRQHDVVLYESERRLGGHTHTHTVQRAGAALHIDSGFIVFNPQNYPLLTRLFAELSVASQPTTMSFSVQDEATGLEYNAGNLSGLFCQRRNLLSPRFWRMLADLKRFYREAPALLELDHAGPDLGDYLRQNRYSDAFISSHLVPMASALWSSPSAQIMKFPAKYLVRFMANHHMLQVSGRPEWRVVCGGSARYVESMTSNWNVDVRLGCAVRQIRRAGDAVHVTSANGSDAFDHVVVACHADQALALIEQPVPAERQVLGAFRFQPNETVLHTDARLLPGNKRAWAAWNAFLPADPADDCTVSYCMNLLQSLSTDEPFVVTLNRSAAIDPSKIIARMHYRHPVYTRESVAAQSRRSEISGVQRLWFAGAYWGWGFHEDGLRSAVDVARAMGVEWK
jgi:uncharacterized protein